MKLAVFAWALFGAGIAAAQYTTPAPGKYIDNEASFGVLMVKADHTFQINTMSSNGHTCDVGGQITNGIAKFDEEVACEITFKTEGGNVRVSARPEGGCRQFCGMRASFVGLYQKPGPLCTRSAMERSRAAFKKNYLAKNFKSAFEALKSVATQCRPFMDAIEAAWVLNDLALTQFKLGDPAACAKTLLPLMMYSTMSDAEVREFFPPADVDAYLLIARATRTNLRLCTPR